MDVKPLCKKLEWLYLSFTIIEKDTKIYNITIILLRYELNKIYNINPTKMYNAYDVITPVFNLAILLLILSSPFINPCGPIYSTDPLSSTFVVCPPSFNTRPVINLL